jgi:hypothetical protein
MSYKTITWSFGKLLIATMLILTVLLAACQNESNITDATPAAIVAPETAGITNTDTNIDGQANVYSDDTLGGEVATTENDAVISEAAVNSEVATTVEETDQNVDEILSAGLSESEADGLVYMREEEKLARDVYLALYEQWGLSIFQNIASSEQAHMDAVLMLLNQYGLADPAANQGTGEFTNPVFQSLYDQLLAQGSQSAGDALKVGGAIEELDILDLEERIADTNEESIVQVYSNLLAGSENHLRSFVSTLARQTGDSYLSTYLSQEAYQAIIDGAQARGNGNGGGYSVSSNEGDPSAGNISGTGNQYGRQNGKGRSGN